jgi:hypothetical protein
MRNADRHRERILLIHLLTWNEKANSMQYSKRLLELALAIPLLFLPFQIQARNSVDSRSLSLSSSFKLSWPTQLEAHVFPAFAQRGFLISGQHSGSVFTVWVSHQAPPTFANIRSVDRLWKANLNVVKESGETFEDLNCNAIANNSHAFRCVRKLGSLTGSFVHESLYWNLKSDLVVVRVMSKLSLQDAEEISGKIEADFSARTPSGRASQ